jgi:hypothetical protein
MRNITSLLLLFVCVAFIPPRSVSGKRLKAAAVVAKFGGECQGMSFHPSPRLDRLIKKTGKREASPCTSPFCVGAFSYDLNGDGRNEYFVRLGCGATGNCTWGVFSDGRARLRGAFTAWFIYIHRSSGSWSVLTTYTREGGDRGVIATLANRTGRYVETSKRVEMGDYRNPQPFLTRMGVPKCEVSRGVQPIKALQLTARFIALH